MTPPPTELPQRLVVLLRGPLAVGKTTASEKLRDLLAPCAVIGVDKLRRMTSDADLSPRRLELAKRNAALLAQEFLDAGYRVVVESVFEREEHLRLVRDALDEVADVRTVLLTASLETLERRDATKSSPNFERVEEMHDRVRSFGEDLVVATDGKSPDAVAAAVVSGLAAVAAATPRLLSRS
jgi:predicted kinase